MPEGKIDSLRGIAQRFKDGKLSLEQAALEAGMSEEQFQQAVRGFAWLEEKAGGAASVAGSAAKAGRRLWSRWTGLE